MRGEERLAILGKVGLVGFQHAVEPREELLRAVIRVHDYGDSVVRGHGTDVKGERDGPGGAGVLVRDGLTGHELTSAVGGLDHHGGVAFGGGFHDCVRGGGTAHDDKERCVKCKMNVRINYETILSQNGHMNYRCLPGAVEGGDGISVVFRVLEERDNIVSGDNTNRHIAGSNHFGR